MKVRSSLSVPVFCVLLCVSLLGCGSSDKNYTLTGRVVSKVPATRTLVLDHDNIPGFMAAMTMPYPLAMALVEALYRSSERPVSHSRLTNERKFQQQSIV